MHSSPFSTLTHTRTLNSHTDTIIIKKRRKYAHTHSFAPSKFIHGTHIHGKRQCFWQTRMNFLVKMDGWLTGWLAGFACCSSLLCLLFVSFVHSFLYSLLRLLFYVILISVFPLFSCLFCAFLLSFINKNCTIFTELQFVDIWGK